MGYLFMDKKIDENKEKKVENGQILKVNSSLDFNKLAKSMNRNQYMGFENIISKLISDEKTNQHSSENKPNKNEEIKQPLSQVEDKINSETKITKSEEQKQIEQVLTRVNSSGQNEVTVETEDDAIKRRILQRLAQNDNTQSPRVEIKQKINAQTTITDENFSTNDTENIDNISNDNSNGNNLENSPNNDTIEFETPDGNFPSSNNSDNTETTKIQEDMTTEKNIPLEFCENIDNAQTSSSQQDDPPKIKGNSSKFVKYLILLLVFIGVVFSCYKYLYKASGTDFITQETRVIYVNENVSLKNFESFLSFGTNEEIARYQKNSENFKYISKFYCYSDKEFVNFSKKSVTFVVDPGIWYFVALTKINENFDYINNVYILKKSVQVEYFGDKFDEDIYMQPYRGLFIFSLNEKTLKTFLEKKDNYKYNKNIENQLYTNRKHSLGTLIYNNAGNQFYGVKLLTLTGNIQDDSLKFNLDIDLGNNSDLRYKVSENKRKLLTYVKKNDLYINLEKFSKIEEIIFSPHLFGKNNKKLSILNTWQVLFGVKISDILSEVDGEAIFRSDNNSIMLKMKKEFPVTQRFLSILDEKMKILNINSNVKIKENVVTIGVENFKKSKNPYQIPKNTFVFGEFDLSNRANGNQFIVQIEGSGQILEAQITISKKAVQEMRK